jgi:hypothetical protein
MMTTANQAQDLATVPNNTLSQALRFEPRNFPEAVKVAAMVASIGLCGVKNEADAMARIMLGASLGLPTMVSIQNIFTIPSDTGPKPGIYATLAVALCNEHPQCEYLKCIETTATKATYEIKRKGRDPRTLSWTIEDAQRAGLTGRGGDNAKANNWTKYPAEMLRARASMAIIRMEIPEAIMGLHSREELEDTLPAERTNMEIISQAPLRDFTAERNAIAQQICDAKTNEEKKVARAAVKAFGEEGQDITELRRLYDMTHGKAPHAAATEEPAQS